MTNECDLHLLLQCFWSIEEPLHSTKTSPQDEKCEVHFVFIHTRDASSRYVCHLPFSRVTYPSQLGVSITLAKCMFNTLECKFYEWLLGILAHETVHIYALSEQDALPFATPGGFKDGKVYVVFSASSPSFRYFIEPHSTSGPKVVHWYYRFNSLLSLT